MKNICILFESHKRTISFRNKFGLRNFFLKIPKGAYNFLIEQYSDENFHIIYELKVCLFLDKNSKGETSIVFPCVIGNAHDDFSVCINNETETTEFKHLIEDAIKNYWQSAFTDDILLFQEKFENDECGIPHSTMKRQEEQRDSHFNFLIKWEEITRKDGDVLKFIEHTKFHEYYKPKKLKTVLKFPETTPIIFKSLKQFQVEA